MTLWFQHDDGPVGRVDGAAIKLHLAERAAVGTRQLQRDIGGGFTHRPFLNADAQGATDSVGGGFNLAEMDRAFRPPFGCMKIGGGFSGFLHQAVQFLLEGLDFFVHDLGSGIEFLANASLRAINSPILTEFMPNLLLTFSKSPKPVQKLTCTLLC